MMSSWRRTRVSTATRGSPDVETAETIRSFVLKLGDPAYDLPGFAGMAGKFHLELISWRSVGFTIS